MNKKGQSLNGLSRAVLIIVLIGIAIGVGTMILGQLAKNVDVQGQTTIRVDNETIDADYITHLLTPTYGGARVANVDRGVTFLYFTNSTEEYNIVAANFTTIPSDGVFYLNNASTGYDLFNATAINVSYTYQQSGVAFKAVNGTGSAIVNVTEWLPIIVLVIMAALILGLIVKSFIGKHE